MRLLILLLIAGALGVVMLSDGIVIAWDSEAYLGAALTIQQGGGIPRDWAAYAPLYPILLALFPPERMIDGAALLNIAAFVVFALLIAGLFPHDRRIFLLPVLVFASGAIRYVHEYAISEPWFIAFVLAFVTGIQRRSWAIMMVGAALACLQRYAGVVLIPAGILALWQMHRTSAIPLFAIGATAPIGLWMLRNIMTVGAPMGVRAAPTMSLYVSIEATIYTILAWLPLLLVASMSMPRARLSSAARTALVVYAGAYVILIAWSAATTSIDVPGDRLLAPVFPALLLLMAGRADYPASVPSGRSGPSA